MAITTRPFGVTSDGQAATLYTMTNRSGASVSVTDFGAITVSIIVPDRDDKLADVCLGFDDVAKYEAKHGSMGDTVGRYGNRIAKGQFTLDGVSYQLELNNGANHLHGGFKGFSSYMWEAAPTEGEHLDKVAFHRVSPDGESFYPGTLDVTVTYSWDDDCNLCIRYEATTDKATLCNMTNHSYFNLAGHDHGTIRDHAVYIDSDVITPVDAGLIPTGGYDHNFILRKGLAMGLCACVHHEESGRTMEVITDQPAMQLYTACTTDLEGGKGGAHYGPLSGLCLETQHCPDDPHNPQYPGTTVLRPGEKYDTTTIYAFRVD